MHIYQNVGGASDSRQTVRSIRFAHFIPKQARVFYFDLREYSEIFDKFDKRKFLMRFQL